MLSHEMISTKTVEKKRFIIEPVPEGRTIMSGKKFDYKTQKRYYSCAVF